MLIMPIKANYVDVVVNIKHIYLNKLGICISQPPALCLALGPGPSSWLPICLHRPWPPIFIFQSWSPICIYLPWPPICIYQSWPPTCVYRPYLPTLTPAMVPNFCLPVSEQDFTTTTTATSTITTTNATTTTSTATTTIATPTTINNYYKRCLRGSKICIKWPLKVN